jgi:GDPmannose 4,6-dehydratase
MRPCTPYGAAKLYAHWITTTYRDGFGLFACSGILYNHESAWRSLEFVTRKITDAVARIRLGRLDCLRLGRLDARRDWGYAPEYVEAMHRMLQLPEPANLVLATGRTASIRDFAAMAFRAAGLEVEFRGEGIGEIGVERATGRTVVSVDPSLYRPLEPAQLVGDPARARSALGWEPAKALEAICAEMVDADVRRQAAGALPS